MKKICLITTSPLIVNFFLVPYLRELRALGDVYLALGVDEDVALKQTHGATTYRIPIKRHIAPWHDVVALVQLTRFLVRNRPDVVHSFGPKAGLLVALAGWLARIPVRIHTFTGQVWMTRKGLMRRMLRAADKLLAALDTHLLADSASQRDLLVADGLVAPEKCKVLASGSVSGVDTSRFRPDAAARAEIRSALEIPADALVYLFLGRVTRDKGVLDLARAFATAGADIGYLVFVGPDEQGLQPEIERLCDAQRARLRFVPYTAAPERYLASADVLCLPSYREGFGTSIIEGAATGIPALASGIYGISDAVVDGVTGLLHPPGAVDAIAGGMRRLAQDSNLRGQLGGAAHQRAVVEFSEAHVMSAVLEFYRETLRGGAA